VQTSVSTGIGAPQTLQFIMVDMVFSSNKALQTLLKTGGSGGVVDTSPAKFA
jgi:hypothetical protein